MAKICYFCEKKYFQATVRKKLRSKYNPTKKKRQKPNLQWTRLSNGEKVLACTSCISALYKV